jgi:hypothetical protein
LTTEEPVDKLVCACKRLLRANLLRHGCPD